MIIAGDNFFDFDLTALTDYGGKVRPHGLIAVYDVGDRELAKRYGLVRTSEDGKVLEFQEKPPEPKTTLASCGIYWLPKEIWGLLDTYIKGGHNTDQPGHYMRWLAEISGLYAFPLKGKWLDIGDIASYQKANAIVG
jgi:glucose-1-phosphate thymidylyltransferase